MTGLDILVLLLMGGAAVFGFTRGFVTEALSLGAWVFAIAVVKTFHSPVAAALEKSIGTPSGASMLATPERTDSATRAASLRRCSSSVVASLAARWARDRVDLSGGVTVTLHRT